MKINDLKSELKNGVLRKTKYKLELYVPGEDSRSLQILCQGVSFPQRVITPVKLFHKGRPFLVRSEMEFGGSVRVRFLENSNMDVRRMMDFWMKNVDDSNITPSEDQSGIQQLSTAVTKEINSAVNLVNNIKSMKKLKDSQSQMLDFLTNSQDANGFPNYQTNMRLWQLDHNGKEVYGYEYQNAFIQGIHEGDFQQGAINEIQSIAVDIAYSEAIPLQSRTSGTVGKIVGTEITDTFQRTKKLF